MFRIVRRVAALVALGFAVAAIPGASAAEAAITCVSPNAPYKHTRITGQKQVYAHAYASCAASNLTVTATIHKWNGSSWVKYSNTATSGYDAFAYDFLCSNYGWGGSGSGYFATYATARWSTPYGTQTQGRWSGSRYLSC